MNSIGIGSLAIIVMAVTVATVITIKGKIQRFKKLQKSPHLTIEADLTDEKLEEHIMNLSEKEKVLIVAILMLGGIAIKIKDRDKKATEAEAAKEINEVLDAINKTEMMKFR